MRSRNPHRQGLLTGSALLSGRRYWSPGHHALGHCRIIAWWVCAVVPHRCRWGGRHHANVGGRGDPQGRDIEEYTPLKMGLDVPKPMVRDEMMVAKTATAESTMQSTTEPPGPRARIGIGYAPHHEQQDEQECLDGFAHTRSPFSGSGTTAAPYPLIPKERSTILFPKYIISTDGTL